MEWGHSIARRYVPPTRRSTSAAGQGKPFGPPPLLSCSGSGKGAETCSGEAWNIRSMTSCPAGVAVRRSTDARVSGMVALLVWRVVLVSEMGVEMGVETVEAVGPFGVGAAEPIVHWKQAFESESGGTALSVARAIDQPRALQHLQVVRDPGLGQRGCLRQLDDAGVPSREPLEDRATRRVGERREGTTDGIAGGLHNQKVI